VSVDEALQRLIELGTSAGESADAVRAESAALTAAVVGRPAAQAWATAFGAQPVAFDASLNAAQSFTRRATPVLARLVNAGAPGAPDYAQALAELASAGCSLGQPSLTSVGNASIIAAAQLGAIPVAGRPTPIPPPACESPTARDQPAIGPAAPQKTLAELLAELDALVGLEAVKNEVRRQSEVLRIAKLRAGKHLADVPMTRHLVFVGNPGTGKTTVARLVADIFRALGVLAVGQLVECDRSSLVAGYVGQTAIKTAEMAQKAVGGALFIDEAYALAEDDFGAEAVATLVKAMEDHRDELVVIVAGYPEPMVGFIDTNPGLASRFRRTLEFADYSDAELVEIFLRITAAADFEPTPGCLADLRRVLLVTVRDRGFGNARFIRNLFEAAVVRQAWRLRDQPDPTVAQLRELTDADLSDPLPSPASAVAQVEAGTIDSRPVTP
jgi:hypothetical protein